MTRTILVILPAREVLTSYAALPAVDEPPSPVIRSQIQPTSGIIEAVDMMSNQKKNVKKYSSLEMEARMISIVKINRQMKVMLYIMLS